MHRHYFLGNSPQASSRRSSNPAADAAMERYACGDVRAFAHLYDALAPRLYGFALAKLRDRGKAEDLVQQTLLQLHCARGRFVAGSPVTPWAFSIISRLFLDQVRRKCLEVLTADGNQDASHASDRPGPEDAVQGGQLNQLLGDAISRLPVGQRQAIELVYYGQMSHAEAAEVLGVTVSSVKLRVVRATVALRSDARLLTHGLVECDA